MANTNSLTPEQLAVLKQAADILQQNSGAPPPRPRSMTPEQYDDHVAAANAETKRNAAHDVNPRAFVLALADRIDAIEEHLGIDAQAKSADSTKAAAKAS